MSPAFLQCGPVKLFGGVHTWLSALIAILPLATAPRACAQDHSLRVATFNIHYANEDLAAIASAIDDAAPTIVCIQESNRQSERYFRKTYLRQFPHQHFAAHRGEYLEEGLAILSKVPLSNLRFEPPLSGLFGSYYATFKFNGRNVRIANVHLSPFLIRPGSGFIEAYQAIQTSEDTHEREISTILKSVGSSVPTLICGDFNSLSWLAAPKRLVTERFTDSFASVTDNADMHSTWTSPMGRLTLQGRIDYIFHSRDFTTKSSRIIKTNSSDHYLLVSELEIVNENR